MKNSFSSLGLSENMLETINKKGFEEPTEIQSKIIPLILKNELDLIGQAQTGTGKTAAFAIPILELLDNHKGNIQALVLVPTRELAIQVAEEFHSFRGNKNLRTAPIYGGQSYDIQFRHLKKGVDIVVGTPGRIIDHLNRGSLEFNGLSFVVLDEADEMLNMGFMDDIEDILSRTNSERRTLLFSATIPDRISQLAKKFMKKREIVKTKNSGKTIHLTDQVYFEVKEGDKLETLCRIIDTTNEFFGLVFCRTKRDVDYVTSKLHDRDYDAEGLHGDISQNIREKILNKFKAKKINVLVATDVAARGLDIDELTHVINYALPQDAESYLHRIGRTGRAGKEGAAITFVTPEEHRKLMYIKSSTQTEIRKEKVPQIKEVIKFKKDKISSNLKTIVNLNDAEQYLTLTRELLDEFDAEKIVSSLIKHIYQSDLEEKNYAEINDYSDYKKKKYSDDDRSFGRDKRNRSSKSDKFESSRERSKSDRYDSPREKSKSTRTVGAARLFLAMGKKDDLTPVEILKLVKKKTGIEGNRISEISINDTFSFFNVTDKDADIIIDKLNSKSSGKKPLIERAKYPK
ncbi:MAG: RNA helicase [Chlorobiaceae bacterium]|nr:RNA helicase [Chlorobiaceae bacterium]MBA4309019.1 RNA helicase [Chlorobiaceae bacterium]